jgi:hypothetical protein
MSPRRRQYLPPGVQSSVPGRCQYGMAHWEAPTAFDEYTSIGLLTTDPTRPSPTPSEALRDADVALYAAKAAGKNRVVAFRPELRAAQLDYTRLRTGLARALANNELAVHYQPIVNLTTHRIVKVETSPCPVPCPAQRPPGREAWPPTLPYGGHSLTPPRRRPRRRRR